MILRIVVFCNETQLEGKNTNEGKKKEAKWYREMEKQERN